MLLMLKREKWHEKTPYKNRVLPAFIRLFLWIDFQLLNKELLIFGSI